MAAEAPALLRLEDALERMLSGVEPLPAEHIPLRSALGLVLAEPVRARVTLPPWDNSAMDGFAVRSVDVAGASSDAPIRLRVVGEVAAGHEPTATVASGTAVRILTGGMMPAGADAVVPIEDTDVPAGAVDLPDTVEVHAGAVAAAHVRRAGSDLTQGMEILEAGRVLGPAQLAVAAAGGHGNVLAHRRPRVAVVATGDELVPVGEPLRPATIHDSNSISLTAQALAAGAEVIEMGIASDDHEAVRMRVAEAVRRADIVVASGGVSVGVHDVVKDVFSSLGQLDLWRVAVQPGKPLAFGRAPRAEGGEALLFGLPGNPVSSFVTFELFVRPVLRRLAGHREPMGRRTERAMLTEPVTKSAGRRAFLRVRLERAGPTDGWSASLAGGQGSHVLSALAQADGLAIVPEDVDALPAGSVVDVILLGTSAC